MGIFLSFQCPVEIPGVTVTNFIKTAINETRKGKGLEEMPANVMLKKIKEKAKLLSIDTQFLSRSLNEGFSGGEKKRNEIFQMAMLEPKLAILDETDSGLDIDAMRIVANGVNTLRNDDNAIIVITHYQRLLDYIVPDFVHVLHEGKIVKSGSKELAIERRKRIRLDQTSNLMDLQEKLVASYMAQTSANTEPVGLTKIRSAAIETFEQQGFPTKKMEEWKYTPLNKLVKTDYTVFPKKSKNLTLEEVQNYILHDVDTFKIVFVDGVYSSFLSETTHEGMDVCLLSAALSQPKFLKVNSSILTLLQIQKIHLLHLIPLWSRRSLCAYP